MRKRSSCDGFQQSAVSVPVFTGSFDSVFSGSEEMAQSGAVAVQLHKNAIAALEVPRFPGTPSLL